MKLDKLEHLLVSVVIVLLLWAGLSFVLEQMSALAVASGLALLTGATKELVYDGLMDEGDPSWADFAADCVGVAIGAAAVWLAVSL